MRASAGKNAAGLPLTPGPEGQRLAIRHSYTTLGYLKSVSNSATGRVYWRADQADEQGHLTQQTYANGVATTRSWDRMGRLVSSAAGTGNAVYNDSYGYDHLGNLRLRTDTRAGVILTHEYDYDNLNRLKTEARSGGGVGSTQTIAWAYDAIGNITSRSDVGTFTYPAAGGVRPHAVTGVTGTVNGVANPSYSYDANGNVTATAGRTAVWTSFNLPATLTRGSNQLAWAYDPEHERVREHLRVNGTLTRSTVYLNPAAGAGLWYEEEVSGGVLKRRHYISGTEGAVVQVTRQAGVADQERYWHKDHLGSTTVVTNEAGAVVERLGYEPFGKRRQADGRTDAGGTLAGTTTDRGYTGHEMLDEVGLVHMNGRIYDPAIGRFLSADPNVPDPSDIQSHNRYSYVRNRPMSVTDPSGFLDLLPEGGGYGIAGYVDSPRGRHFQAIGFTTLPTEAGFALGYDPVATYNNGGQGFQATADAKPGRAGMSLYDRFSTWGHVLLSGAGTIPGVGVLPDALDFLWTAAEVPFDKSTASDLALAGAGIGATVAPVAGDGAAAAAKIMARLVGRGEALAADGARAAAHACPCCFVAGTPVLTQAGPMPIEQVGIGTLVLSRDEHSGLTELKPVVDVILSDGRQLYGLTFIDERGHSTRIESSDNHPFWVLDQGWVDSAKLQRGMKVPTHDGSTLMVVNVANLGRQGLTYNLTVADFHTFFAGERGAFVHNNGCACSAVIKAKPDFVVSSDGAVVHSSPDKVRASLEGAGLQGRGVQNAAGTETGTIHNVPGKKMDVRVMDGGPNHPARVVTSRQGTSQPVNPANGSNFGNVPKAEQRERSHIVFP